MTKIERIDINWLETNDGQIEGLPKNPRTWTAEELKKIARSLKETPELFDMRPCIVCPMPRDKETHYVVLGGNLRLEGARFNGEKTVPCIVVPEKTPVEKLKEIVIKDNGSFGEWAGDLLAQDWAGLPLDDWGVTGWEGEEVGASGSGGTEAVNTTEDNFNEEEEKIPAVCKAGDLWQLGEHRLLCGDSTKAEDVERLMDGAKADLFLTDPPYNVDYVSKNEAMNALDNGNRNQRDIENDKMDEEAYQAFLTSVFDNAKDIALRPGAVFYIWYASSQGYNVKKAAKDSGLSVRQVLIWNKNRFVMGRQDYQWKHEPCLYGWTEGAAHYFFDSRSETTVIEDAATVDIKKMKKDEMARMIQDILSSGRATSVIDCPKPVSSAMHPTMKPIRLFGYLMRNSSRQGESVLDLFGGSGTTIIAAEQMGRKAYVMEFDPHYCDVIIARWEKETGLKAEKIA